MKLSTALATIAILVSFCIPFPASADITTGLTVGQAAHTADYDHCDWWDSPTISWNLKIKNWDPDYDPTGTGDSDGNPVFTTLDSGTSAHGSMEEPTSVCFEIRASIAQYYQPAFINGKIVKYAIRNYNQKNASFSVTAWSGIMGRQY